MKKIKTWLDHSIVKLLADCAASDWPNRFRPAMGRWMHVRMTATRGETGVTKQHRLCPTTTNNGQHCGQGHWRGLVPNVARPGLRRDTRQPGRLSRRGIDY